MVRHRSTSRDRDRSKKHKERERDRDKERERERDRDRHRHSKQTKRSRSRSRSRSPRYRRDKRSSPSPHRRRSSSSRSPSPKADYLTLGNVRPKFSALNSDNPFILDPLAMEGKTEDEIEMMKVMGFAGFDTTKGKHVDGACNAYAVNVQQKRRYRQYMNRKGGFNRPLDPVA